MDHFDGPGIDGALYVQGQRHEKSLGLLTSRFIDMLQEAPDGIADLNLVRFSN